MRLHAQPHSIPTARVRRQPIAILPFVGLLLLAACGGAAAPSTDSGAPSEQPTPAPASTPEPTATPSPEATTAPASTADDSTGLADCFSGDMPNLDSGWKFIKGGVKGGEATYGVAYPEDWDDLSGQGAFTAGTLLDKQTIDELGLASDATIKADFVRAPDGLPNLSVFRFGTVESSATTIQEREVARYGKLDDIERILDTAIEGCLGGTRASGLAMEFRSSDGNTYYQQNLFGVRNGELYVVQWLDRLDPNTDLLAQVLTTWGWIGFEEPSGGGSGGGIAGASMASSVDDTLAEPDPSTFVTSFPTDAPTIYVVYQPEEGAVGTVHLTWLFEGDLVLEGSLDLTADAPWAWGGITPPSGGFRPGNYEVQLELNGKVATIPFTVEAAS